MTSHRGGPAATAGKWPKRLPPLSPEQEAIGDDFVRHWLEVFASRYGIVSRFNHDYVVRNAPAAFVRTLEVGCGDGEHLHYERLSDAQADGYHAVDIRWNMVDVFRSRFPGIRASVADCQTRMPFEDGWFDRILAVHVLEHLPDLPAAIRELHRVCDKRSGCLSVVIPCEGGLAYGLARKVSAERIFRKRYRQSYRWFIEREHLNTPGEIIEELGRYFEIGGTEYFPLRVPVTSLNLCIGLTARPRRD